MISKLSETVPTDIFLTVFVVLLIVGYFIYKELPEFRQRMGAAERKKQKDKGDKDALIRRLDGMDERLKSIETKFDDMDRKLSRDYNRINDMDDENRRTRQIVSQSLREREIIMRALLAALEGLQEIGADGQTKAAQKEISDYLNEQAHSDRIF